VELISWKDAKKFCEWLTKKGEKGYTVRLPGEAEWEYACRAGSKTRFYFGNNQSDLPKYANIGDLDYSKATGESVAVTFSDGYGYGAPVGSYKPNAFGLYDMIGNVSEWCEDWYGSYAYLPKGNNQIQSRVSETRIQRGGDWCSSPKFCRTACRIECGEYRVSIAVGFRIAAVKEDE
jgi:formylglycine-generating enzyme required for sulfatase activity